ncbi:FAD synthase-like [Leptopilina heterotoma]|uniref:FAD synthase-like n=1 Tax=Leptopilina heterotoma TaxID=63436 RepID=UPI001CAA3108|nr:FAD synthase-like [Leptopilina heterotoma]
MQSHRAFYIFGFNVQNYLKIIRRLNCTLSNHHTAGILIIGDEILKAQVKDTNSHFISNLLYKCGVKVKKISVLSDDVDEIANEIRDFSRKYTHVITSGGIGPTHDDVTFEGLGKAFGCPLYYHPTLVDIVKNKFGVTSDSSPGFKLAYIPKEASLYFGVNHETGRPLAYPCIKLKNVCVFPGSPNFLRGSFGSLYNKLFGTNKNFVTTQVFLNAREEVFADALTSVSKEFPLVNFGSYPEFIHSYYRARITIESDTEAMTQKAKERFCSLIPTNILIDYDSSPMENVIMKYEHFLDNQKEKRNFYENSLRHIEYIYQDTDNVGIYFDSNVESTVMLHLAFVANKRILKNGNKLRLLCFQKETLSPADEDFLNQLIDTYNADIMLFKETPQKDIEVLKWKIPKLKFILVGAKSDVEKREIYNLKDDVLNGIKIEFPLMNWTDTDVWTFVRSLSLSYCPIYDKS